MEDLAVLIVGLGIQLCFIISTALGAGVKGEDIAPLLSLSLYRHLQNFIGRVIGQRDDLKVALFAGFGVFGQDFVANFDFFNGLLTFFGLDRRAGGEGVGTPLCQLMNK